MSEVDYEVVGQVRAAVAAGLRDERRRRAAAGLVMLDTADERQLARSLSAAELRRRGDLLDAAAPTGAEEGVATSEDGADRAGAVARAVEAALFGLGRLEPLMADPDLVNIEINGHDRVWLYRADGRVEAGPPVAGSDAELIDWVRSAATYAGLSSRPFDPAHPWLELRLPDGSRLCALMSVVERPVVSIRLFRSRRVLLEDLAARGAFSPEVEAFLRAAVPARANLMVSGETFAGKTTLLRALGNLIPFGERIVTAEHFLELGFEAFPDLHRDVVAMEERLPNSEGAGGLSLAELVERSRRMNPDRIIVGEVIGGEIVAMLDAMTQGEDGSMSTIHARTSATVFHRIATYALISPHRLPVQASGLLTAGALDFVVHMGKATGSDGRVRRWVSSIREVCGFDGQQVISSEVFATRPGSLTAEPAAAISPARLDRLAGYRPGMGSAA